MRVFVVETLLDKPDANTLSNLATMIFHLDTTGEEVLKDLLTVGLNVSEEDSLCGLLQNYIKLSSDESFTKIVEESLHRMIIAGRSYPSYELMNLLWKIAPIEELVGLCRYAVHITVWSVGIKPALLLAQSLYKGASNMSIDARVLALDALREVHTLSGLSEDIIALKKVNKGK